MPHDAFALILLRLGTGEVARRRDLTSLDDMTSQSILDKSKLTVEELQS